MTELIEFTYKNHRGEIRIRQILRQGASIEFINRPGYGYQPGWFLSGIDVGKDERRSFALNSIILPDDNLSVCRLFSI